MNGECEHIKATTEIKFPVELVCEECIKTGNTWLHLRTCQTCGVTLCCDESKYKHATKHYHRSGHPVIISAEPGERWLWCYKDSVMAAY